MPTVRRLTITLVLGAPFLLGVPRSHLPSDHRASPSVAQAQSAAPAPVRIYLPPARITPPAPGPVPVRRVALPRPGLAPDPEQALFGKLDRQVRRTRRLAWTPGLSTVSRVGHRLLYRKGYLGEVPVHLVVADMNDPQVRLGILVARGGVGTTESFASMVQRARPAAAITGTFFGLKNRLPTGDLVVNGRAIYQGFVGTALAFTEGNVVSFIPTTYKSKTAWRFFDGVMRAGPLLVQSGRIAVGPREEGFVSLSPAAPRTRTAVGITPGRKLLLLAVKKPISLWRLAKLMRELGAYHAVAMDGGTSTGLYAGGQMVARPGRDLTNALVVYAHRDRYERARNSFLGGPASRLEVRRAQQPPSLLLQVEPAADDTPAIPGGKTAPLPEEGQPTYHPDPVLTVPPRSDIADPLTSTPAALAGASATAPSAAAEQ